MTATETPIEQIVAPRADETMFMSRRRNLRLVKVPILPRYGISGQKVGDQPGVTVEFRDGVLRIPTTGDVTCVDGRKAPAPEICEWMLGHHLRGDVNEGFWTVDPTAPAASKEEMLEVMRAAQSFDAERLQAIIDQERAGWERDTIIDTAQEALDMVRQLEAETQAEKDK